MLFPEPVSPIRTTAGFLSTASTIVSSNLRMGSADSIDGGRKILAKGEEKRRIWYERGREGF